MVGWKDGKLQEDYELYKIDRRAASRAVANTKTRKQIEFAEEVDSKEGRTKVLRIAKQWPKSR